MTSARDDLQRLLAEAPFVHALAKRLVADEADDVVQQAYVHALEQRPRSVADPRRWLAAVVRNLAFDRTRRRRRVDERERGAAAHERVPSTLELMQLEERRRALVHAVDRLPEHQRTVVLLRFYEGLPPRRIAAQLDLPVTTVSNRLHKALQVLRAQLDAEHGGERRAWLLPLIPFAATPRTLPWREVTATSATPAAVAGVISMATKMQLAAMAAAGVVLVGGLGMIVTTSGRPLPAIPDQPIASSRSVAAQTSASAVTRVELEPMPDRSAAGRATDEGVVQGGTEQVFSFRDRSGGALKGQVVIVSARLLAESEPPPIAASAQSADEFCAAATSDTDGIARIVVPHGAFHVAVRPTAGHALRRSDLPRGVEPVLLPAPPIEFELWPIWAAGIRIRNGVAVTGRCSFVRARFEGSGDHALLRASEQLAAKWRRDPGDQVFAWAAFAKLPGVAPMAKPTFLLERKGWQSVTIDMTRAADTEPVVIDADDLEDSAFGALHVEWSRGGLAPLHEIESADITDWDDPHFVSRVIQGRDVLLLPPGRYAVRGMIGNDELSPPREVQVTIGGTTSVSLDPPPGVAILAIDAEPAPGRARQNLRFELRQGGVVVDKRFLPAAREHCLFATPGRYEATLTTTGCEVEAADLRLTTHTITRWETRLEPRQR